MNDSSFILDTKKLTPSPLLETLLDMTHHGICVTRAQGAVLLANEQLTGWTGHVHLRHLNQLWNCDDLIQLQKSLQNSATRPPSLNLSLQCSNGAFIPVNVRIQRFIEDRTPLHVLVISDLRKEQQWESTLASTQEQHLHFLYAVSSAVCIVRQDTGEILTSNEPFANWYGLPLDSLQGQLISAFFPDFQTWPSLCSQLERQSSGRVEIQASIYHPEQGKGWARILAHRIHFDGYDAVLLSIEDVTQLCESQRALEEATQLLKAVVTTQSQFVSDIDPEMLFQHILDHIFSMSYCRFGFIVSLDQNQTLQTQAFNHKDWNFDTVSDYVKHRLNDDFRQWYQEGNPLFEALKEGAFRTFYETSKDLPYPWLKNFAGVALFSGGEKVGMLGIGNYPTHEGLLDSHMFVRINPLLVTTGNTIKAWNNHQELKAEQSDHLKKKREVEHSSQDIQKLMAYAAAPVFCIDIRKIITYWNHSARRMTGLSQSAVEGIMYVFRLVAKEDHHRLEHAIKEAFADRTLGDLKLRIKTTAGYEHVLCSFSPKHDANGDIVGAWVVTQNIMVQVDYQARLEEEVKTKTAHMQQAISSHQQTLTELKQAKHQQQESSDFQHRFAALASHEFRGPLSAIQMTAENLENHFEHFSREDILRKIGRIRQRSHQLHNQAHDILLLTQLDSDGGTFHPVVCDVEELCLNIAEQIMIQTKHTHAIEVHLSPIHARLDSRLITLILSNLLDNAIKYSPDAEQVHLILRQEGYFLIFEVRDTGIGVLSDETQEIFKPFYRSPRVFTNTQGSGLGLEIVQRSLRLHKGEIELSSSPTGSTFKVLIPYRSL